MSKEPLANETFARDCLRNIRRDLTDEVAIATLNRLDIALRKCDRITFTEVCGSLPEIVKEDTDPWRIRERLQVVSLIRYPIWPLDPRKEFLGQRERIESIGRTHANHSDHLILRHAGRIIAPIIRKSFSAPVKGKHGPGVVAESSNPIDKRFVVYVDPKLRQYMHVIPEPFGNHPIVWRNGVTRALMVPKDHKSLRSISAEPTWTQWVQQAYMTSLMSTIEDDPRFCGHIAFKDQTRQHALLKRDVATIDLSDASDSLRVKHLLLCKLPLDVRERLLSCRTPLVEYKGVQYPSKGLYPMGAALCFPVETLFFSALLLAYAHAECGKLQNWGVFGDDIICDTYLAGGFCNFLRRIGFKPNMKKTFIGGLFKETCGLHLYKGIDVTPVKIKKAYPVSERDVANISYGQYARQSHKLGFDNLSKFLRQKLLAPVDHLNAPIRWSTEYQRLECRILQYKQRSLTGHECQYAESLLYGSSDVPLGVVTTSLGWSPLGECALW